MYILIPLSSNKLEVTKRKDSKHVLLDQPGIEPETPEPITKKLNLGFANLFA